MAIRFACPSCRQPIEVDDNWADQSVGCPYCKKVVTAPAESQWPSGGVHVADRAADDTYQASPNDSPPQPQWSQPHYAGGHGMPHQGWEPERPRKSTSAWIALLLTLVYLVAMVIGWAIMFQIVMARVQEQVGPNPTVQEQQRAIADMQTRMLEEGRLPGNATSATAGIVAILAGLGGVIFSIVSLVKREPLKILSVITLIVCLTSFCCGLYPALSNIALPIAPPPATAPAEAPTPVEVETETGGEARAPTITPSTDARASIAMPSRS